MMNMLELHKMFDLESPTMKKTPKTPEPKIVLTPTRNGIHLQLMTQVRLNRYDMKFMANISEKYLVPGKPLSPGQNALYEKIVHKYRKQLRKLKVNYKDILALGWDVDIIPIEVLQKQTYFRITDGEMQLYFNFNKNQIEEVRSLVHDDAGVHLNAGANNNFGNGQKYNFTWHNSTKTWTGPFNVYLFKQLYKFATDAKVQVESTAMDLVNELNASGTAEEWTPSVKVINGRMYVSHIAETMLPILETIDPTDLSILNVERMCKLGLSAPGIYAHIGEYLESVSPATEHVIKTEVDVDTLRNYVYESGRKVIFHMPELSAKSDKFKQIASLKDCINWGHGDHQVMAEAMLPRFGSTDTADKLDKFLAEGYTTLITTTPLTNLFRSQARVGKFALEADKVIYLKLKETT